MHAVAADGVWKYFGDYPALRGASLEVAKGACVALLGRNGAGKTTLLRILASLSKPSKGASLTSSLGPHRLSRPWHRRLRRSFRPRKPHALRPARRAREPPRRRRSRARTRGPRPRQRRPRARILPRHAPASGHRPRLPAQPRTAPARRTIHLSRRPRRRRAPATARRRPRPRLHHHHVDPSDPRSHGIGERRRPAGSRTDNFLGSPQQ